MKPYTRDATCPKCNTTWQAHRAKITYCAAEEQMSTTYALEGHKSVTTYHAPWITVPEHLHCTCENCGYEWLMECADATKLAQTSSHEIVCPYRNNCPTYDEWLTEHADAERAEPSEDGPPDEATIYSPIDIDCPHCTERIELAVTTPTRAFHPIVVVVARPDNYYYDSTEGCTCGSSVGGDWHIEDCPQYQP